MRSLTLILCLVLMCAASLDSQSEAPDPYSIAVVKFEFQMRSEHGVIHSWSQKGLRRLGDCVTVALLKVLNENDLVDASKIRVYLPMIRDAFSEPQLIERNVDRNPQVTLLLLRYLAQSMVDASLKEQIQLTIDFVTNKAS